MRFHLDRKLARAGWLVPARARRGLLAAALDGADLALCLHRVRAPGASDWAPGMAIRGADLDELVELLLASRPSAARRWLTVTFDDGYEDAAAWVDARAARFPEVQFVLFVCPEKAERGAGFRWDLAELSLREGLEERRAAALVDAPVDLELENAREDLLRVGAHPDFRLATPARLRALAAAPNVALGNHTSCHVPLAALPAADAARELDRSSDAFERLFGPQRHFAFPFGRGYFDATHVARLRARGPGELWDTGQRPHLPAARGPGALVPRLVLDGRLGVRGLVAAIAGRAAIARAAGTLSAARR